MDSNQTNNNTEGPQVNEFKLKNLRNSGLALLFIGVIAFIAGEEVFAFTSIFFGQLFSFTFVAKNERAGFLYSIFSGFVCTYCFISLFNML
jgi:uncharacterized protein YqhQ